MSERDVRYEHLSGLGGRRRGSATSQHHAIRVAAFRAYADHMASDEFQADLTRLVSLAREMPTAYMCAETLSWRCHRRLVSDYLLAQGLIVRHIMPSGELRPHTLTEGARAEGGAVSYPSPDQRRTLFD